jgi:hypothetical protein
MAAFLAHVIRNNLGEQFRTRVQQWYHAYYKRIEGRPNDARIATNHACLAAAFDLFADFMKEVWPEAEEAARTFAEDYLAGLVDEAAGAVEDETPARIFLNTLGELIAYGRIYIVGIDGTYVETDKNRDRIVGYMVHSNSSYQKPFNLIGDEEIIVVSIPMALKAVQEQLRGQNRELLQVSERTLLDQLAALGVLVDPDNVKRLIDKDHSGERTKKTRIRGKSVNAAWIKTKAFQGNRHGMGTAGPVQHRTTAMPAVLPFSDAIPAS